MADVSATAAPPRGLPFSREEFYARASRVRAKIAELGHDALIVTGPENLYYLTGYSTPAYYSTQALVLPREGEPLMFVYAPEVENVRAGSWVEAFASYGPSDEPMSALARALERAGLAGASLGIETLSWFFPVHRYQDLVRELPHARLGACDGVVEAGRALKSEAEIGYIRRAAEIAGDAMRAAEAIMRPGVTEDELAAVIYEASLSRGGEYPGSPPYVSVGPRVCKPHASWSGGVLRQGEQAYVELSACVARYSAALMRTFQLGQLHPTLQRLEEGILTGLERTIGALRPGLTAAEADAVCRDAVAAAGFEYPHESGYSIGICYPPGWNETHVFNLKAGDQRPVQANMVLHLVPHTIVPGVGTVGLSETVLVRQQGAEVLTDFPRRVLVL